jgi:hypothetical protein
MDETNDAEPIENINSTALKYVRTTYLPYLIIYIGVCVGLMILFPTPVIIVWMIALGTFLYSFIFRKIKTEFTEEFGKSIGFNYTKSAGMETVSGKLFQTGHSQSICDVLTGVYQNISMRIFTLCFTIGYGKGSHSYSYTVFESTLDKVVPDILLYSKLYQGVISDFLSGDETVELEGDFNQYFKLRVPKGQEEEAYKIFAPDVMADLIDKAQNVSFEFVGNKLYIYASEIIATREKMQSMFSLSEYLVGLFDKNI